ncbi:Aminoacyl-histidine_dipeptidase [Hexamita inflata]|uniref:Aminoacyl-histidine dipeptidase n=1 Tax=Hexamita inflata TaxID=28002 RepID=A0AA86QBK7_9EUKA|nr:Aminoacyl-histidine dipeptidase [Hexamita inflata]
MSLTENNMKVLEQLPKGYHAVFAEFVKMCEIPHGSGNRAGITSHLKKWAEEHKFEVVVDEIDNVLIRVPATPGCESTPGICLQGHTDMVCVKSPEVVHDFHKDPLKLRIEDGWLKATGTTLGADNGVGIAMGMAAALDKNLKHGPIELLFTSDEEIGLIGASALKTCLKSKYLLNLDSEDFGDITISCAGGFRVTFEKEFQRSALEEAYKVYEVHVHGYLGGHSGVEINLHRANAIKQLAKVINQFPAKAEARIISMVGGTAHNAIPAFCKATFALKTCSGCACQAGCNPENKIKDLFALIHEAFKSEKASIDVKQIETKEQAFSAADSKNIINTLINMPHGPLRVSQDVKDFVETSFATTVLETRGNVMHILGSGRSCHEQELDYLYQQCVALAQLAGWTASEQLARYAGWPAKMDSPLIAITESATKKFSDHVKICAIHAGLEAGMICKCHPGMDAISIGPTILSPHSPQERCLIDTVGKCYEIVAEILKSIIV